MAAVRQYERVFAVLFDWRGTLVQDPPLSWWIERAFERLGRQAQPNELDRLVERIHAATSTPEFLDAELTIDCDSTRHRAVSLRMFHAAGMDSPLAEALYELDFDPGCHPFYPDVPEVLRRLRDASIRIAVVSDIHFDLRPEFEHHGLAPYIDEYVLSFEHGVQKPDPRIFEIALSRLGVSPDETLMVGDRASHDGGAAVAGIPTLLLPPLPAFQPRGLSLVLRAAGIEPSRDPGPASRAP